MEAKGYWIQIKKAMTTGARFHDAGFEDERWGQSHSRRETGKGKGMNFPPEHGPAYILVSG